MRLFLAAAQCMAAAPFANAFSVPFLAPKGHQNPFLPTSNNNKIDRSHPNKNPTLFMDSSSSNDDENSLLEDDLDSIDDAELLNIVTPSQFQALCEQCGISAEGTPAELLQRLRNHASEQAALEAQRRQELQQRVERGVNDDERERHEILGELQGGDEEDDLDEGFFYFNLPTDEKEKATEVTTMANGYKDQIASQTTTPPQKRKEPTKYKPANYVTQSDVLAPPLPPPETATVDEDGNRVVTVYSTTDHNDLTGVAAAQPGSAALSGTDPMSAGSSLGVTGNSQPWDMEGPQQTTKSATTKELEEAKQEVTQLVQSLLAMSGAPAFRDFDLPEELDFDNHEDDDDDDDGSVSSNSYTPSNSKLPGYGTNTNGNVPSDQDLFVGFDPSKVPTHILTKASPSLRANRGQVLQEVLREFELHSVGQDGMAGDSMEDGGGHFRECAKVRAFLEGYRRAEVRKAARTTVTFLLDKLVSEGVDGLDLSLSTMSRSSDDSASTEDAFELNDSLIDYLNDIIREQGKKVDQLIGGMDDKRPQTGSLVHGSDTDDDAISLLWNQTEGENGEMIESIDPQDPKIQKVLQDEYEKAERQQEQETLMAVGRKTSIPDTAPEKMLLLLTLLRERIKTEAAFANDERRRNLKVLAYCLQCNSATDREELILKDLGGSIDRLDSFIELVTSSIEYAESTSYQLKPGKGMPLNVKLLKSMLDLSENIRETQAWKASGLRP